MRTARQAAQSRNRAAEKNKARHTSSPGAGQPCAGCTPEGTPQGRLGGQEFAPFCGCGRALQPRERRTSLRRTAGSAISRKEIIGRTRRLGTGGFQAAYGFGGARRRMDRALALFEKPSSEEGGGVLLHPLVQETGDFFPQVRGVVQPGELKALQRKRRGREEKLPRGLVRPGSQRAS